MRKTILILLAISLLYSMIGCRQRSEEILEPVTFYYQADLSSDEDFDSIISPEIREGADLTEAELLDLYLSGPAADHLVNPFPENLSVLMLTRKGPQVEITLSNQLGQLSGIDLSLACACLASTAFELLNCQIVEIMISGTLIDGKASIMIKQEDLVYIDSSFSSPEA